MNPSLYFNLWKHHPGRKSTPCDKSEYPNQCAIRMSVALALSNVDLSTFDGAKCWMSHEDKFKHILRAQELATWMHKHPEIFGHRKLFTKKEYPKLNHTDFWKMKGIIFFEDGWGPTDHIDIWNGSELKGGDNDYFNVNYKSIWFFQLL
ncbi:type VI secretion system amidase effector protein Tae4 [Chryseobacterium daeguense]|uniref:type VI secretion system amidase effector protein Tae4 n=1 Tax=Chryseobacterium daeguense TaxID=412438 RepID=UPI0009D77886|nr:type VI secretion system amidase effector protein Tae4 [Chryseobacterium daeguense]